MRSITNTYWHLTINREMFDKLSAIIAASDLGYMDRFKLRQTAYRMSVNYFQKKLDTGKDTVYDKSIK